MNKENYYFESTDSLAQYSIWLIVAFIGIPSAVILLNFLSLTQFIFIPIFIIFFTLGLRASIKVEEKGVSIIKKWYFIPYRVYRHTYIDDIWYGGDWGEAEGAMCIVVQLGSKEITMGTRKNMNKLHDELWQYSEGYKSEKNN